MNLLNATISVSAGDALEDVVSTVTDLPESTAEIGDYLAGIIDIVAEYAISYGGRLLAALAVLLIGLRIIKIINKNAIYSVFYQCRSSTAAAIC